MTFKTHPKKMEQKGDAFFKKGKYKKALHHFRAAQQLNPDNIGIYDKLIKAHDQVKEEWEEHDMALSLAWTMKQQELKDPKFKRIHAQAEPEWATIVELIKKLISIQDEGEETQIVEEIVSYKDKALYPLIDFILSLKSRIVPRKS